MAAGLVAVAAPAMAQEELSVSITYITQQEDKPRPLSLVDPVLTDEGLARAAGDRREPDHRPVPQATTTP